MSTQNMSTLGTTVRNSSAFKDFAAAAMAAHLEAEMAPSEGSPREGLWTRLASLAGRPKTEAQASLVDATRALMAHHKEESPKQWKKLAAMAMAKCCLKNWAEGARELISAGASHSDLYNGRSPMTHAASSGSIKCMEALLAAGAAVDGAVGIDTPDRNDGFGETLADESCGETPMIAAVSGRRVEAMEWLRRSGASLDKADARGNSPAHWAAMIFGVDELRGETALGWLANNGAALDMVCKQGQTPMMKAAKSGLFGWQAIEALARTVGGVDKRCSQGQTAAMHAAAANNRQAVMALVRLGATMDEEVFAWAERKQLLSFLFSQIDQAAIMANIPPSGDIGAPTKSSLRL